MKRRHFLSPLNFATLGIDANKFAHCAHSKQNVLTFFLLQWSEADHECLKKKTRMNKKSNPDSSGEHLNEEWIFYRTIVKKNREKLLKYRTN